MGVPISQMWTVARYVLTQKIKGKKRYPRVQQRFTAGNAHHRSTAFLHGGEALFGRQILLENMGRILNFSATGDPTCARPGECPRIMSLAGKSPATCSRMDMPIHFPSCCPRRNGKNMVRNLVIQSAPTAWSTAATKPARWMILLVQFVAFWPRFALPFWAEPMPTPQPWRFWSSRLSPGRPDLWN